MTKINTQLDLIFKKLPKRYHSLVIALTLFICTYLLYLLILHSSLLHYIELKKELHTQTDILSKKSERINSIKALNINKNTKLQELSEVNKVFFSPEESDLFLKSLPQIIGSLGNKVGAIKPFRKDVSKERTNMLRDYIANSTKVRQKDIVYTYILENHAQINSGHNMNDSIAELTKLSRLNKNDIRRVWSQTSDDPLAKLYMEKIKIALEFEGSYTGFLEVLKWLNAQGKQMEFEEMYLQPKRTSNSDLDIRLFVSILVVKENLQ
jgi:hypothetical protein